MTDEKANLKETAPEETEAETSEACNVGDTPENGGAAREEVLEVQDEAAAETVRLSAELAACIVERDTFRDQLLRARADFDNYRKRIARESEQARLSAAQGIIRDLLPVADNLERALEHAGPESAGLAEGVQMVLRQFQDALAQRGLSPIPALGEVFNPNIHEALATLPSEEHAPGTVMSEYQRGYMLGGMVLRPAKVVVSSGPPVESGAPDCMGEPGGAPGAETEEQ